MTFPDAEKCMYSNCGSRVMKNPAVEKIVAMLYRLTVRGSNSDAGNVGQRTMLNVPLDGTM
jgi:glutamate synthase domain-containing protein 1